MHCCQKQYYMGKLLLQHRRAKKTVFIMLFVGQLPLRRQVEKTLIVEHKVDRVQTSPVRNEEEEHASTSDTATVHYSLLYCPIQTDAVPRSKVTPVASTSGSHQGNAIRKISCLCSSLAQGNEGLCGYLTENDYQYHVYRTSQQQSEHFDSIAIDHIIRKEVSPPPSRRQRYELSFILASSYLQLLDTSWLPESWKKSDIVVRQRQEIECGPSRPAPPKSRVRG
ncbi:hypothetical protein GGR54DRAFT_203343 [Hypoxylon sp. NC1633]|nr:hypothetical protein GGR54DRAFT_203343 [Hypoxylon sp. NC1633]